MEDETWVKGKPDTFGLGLEMLPGHQDEDSSRQLNEQA